MFGEQFYPTPPSLIDKMLMDLTGEKIFSILEPSAGKGDILTGIKAWRKANRQIFYQGRDIDIDCIEIDQNLQSVLKGNGYRVIHDDFLTFNSYKKYDLIIMNPPFAVGDRHLLKALELQKQGGEIVCILNAETTKNPYTNTRKLLLNKLNQYSAQIQYLTNEFENAERKTSVEIALVKISIPKTYKDSIFLDGLKKAQMQQEQYGLERKDVITGTLIDGLVESYNFECMTGASFVNEYRKLLMYQSNEEHEEIIEMHISGKKGANVNRYIKLVRRKYWNKLFSNKEWRDKLPSNLLENLYDKVNELQDYEFSVFNIKRLWVETMIQMRSSLEETIIELFDKLSAQHSYAEYSNNIHYFDGWKTNKCYKINKKVIIPVYGAFSSWNGNFKPTDYAISQKFTDIEKVFDYLDMQESDHHSMAAALKLAEGVGKNRKIETKYFYLTFYKKGTAHIEFKDMALLKKFNIFGAQRKGWLPPTYGKKKYAEMGSEEKAVIDSFEGENSYSQVIDNTDYYLLKTDEILMLEGA